MSGKIFMNIVKYSKDEMTTVVSNANDLYSYKVFIGKHTVPVGSDESLWYVEGDTVKTAVSKNITVDQCGVIIKGYTPFDRSCQINHWATLPYIDGCATTQLLPPIRVGDPTFQMLHMPPHSSEQAHHIHSTARIVYVYQGYGECIYGTKVKNHSMPLEEGDTLILDKMVPHHFITHEKSLVVLPLHVWSSPGKDEFNHPMFNGTHEV